jgi:single-strand DNA-binding protein
MKSIVIAGRTGKDAELRRLQDGTPVLSWSVAVDDGRGDSKRTLWFDCALYGKRGKALEQHMPKGTSVTVSGDFSTREHDGKTYFQVRVNDVTLQGGKPDRQQSRSDQGMYTDNAGGSAAALDDDSDLPF